MTKPWDWWRTVFYLIPAVALYTIVLGTASVLSTLVDRRGNFGHRCARAWSWLILRTTGVQVAVEGLDRLDPGRSYVFAANHQSIYDIPILFASLPFQLRIIGSSPRSRSGGFRSWAGTCSARVTCWWIARAPAPAL
jgi:1-acyl-sn-glycerol-3-phosphate acyltransferase